MKGLCGPEAGQVTAQGFGPSDPSLDPLARVA